jgi:hypothetical protein
VVDGEAYAAGDEATVAVGPCPPVALLEDHDNAVFTWLLQSATRDSGGVVGICIRSWSGTDLVAA